MQRSRLIEESQLIPLLDLRTDASVAFSISCSTSSFASRAEHKAQVHRGHLRRHHQMAFVSPASNPVKVGVLDSKASQRARHKEVPDGQ